MTWSQVGGGEGGVVQGEGREVLSRREVGRCCDLVQGLREVLSGGGGVVWGGGVVHSVGEGGGVVT